MKRLAFAAIALVMSMATAAHPKDLAQQLFLETNTVRVAHGQAPVREGLRLREAAQAHADEMAGLEYFSHVSPTPESATVADRLRNAGESAAQYAENLALYNQTDDLAVKVVEGWLESPGHRAALLDPSFTHVGFGVAADGHGRVYVTQVFAWKPWEYIRGVVEDRGEKRLVELRYTLPPHGVTVNVDGVRVPAFIRGDRVAFAVGADDSEFVVGYATDTGPRSFDMFHLVPGSQLVQPGALPKK